MQTIRFLWLCSGLALFICLSGCQRDEPLPPRSEWTTRVAGEVLAADGTPLQGVIAIETGRLYSKDYRYGGMIGPQGNFSIDLPEGGDYGLHVYATGYIYHPVGIRTEEGMVNRFTFHLPPNPAPEDAPVLSEVAFEQPGADSGRVTIRLRVTDPNGNLSHQVLGINARAGESRLFSPPGLVFPWTRDYPDGLYTLDYATGGAPFEIRDWIFLAADNRCYNSPLLVWPFAGNAFLPARAPAAAPEPVDDREQAGKSPEAAGQEVFKGNCAVCHYPDRTETKVGPGLKGLFGREATPVEKLPVTDENIRRRIQNGGEMMPPYAHIEGEDMDALLAYLKTL